MMREEEGFDAADAAVERVFQTLGGEVEHAVAVGQPAAVETLKPRCVECGSRYADGGMDGRHIQMLLGHSDLKTTERYLNSDTKRLAEAMKRATGGRA